MEDPSHQVGAHGRAGGTPAPEHDATPGRAEQPVRCVLLTQPTHDDAPPALLEALRRRSLAVTVCRSTFEALAAILGARQESKGAGGAALVVIEPARADQRRLREMLEALDVFAPRTVRWEFEDSAPVKLHALRPIARPPVQVRAGAGDALARSATAERLRTKPDLRLTGIGELPAGEDEATDEPSAADLLSEDEIDMLLRDDDAEEAR